MMAEDNREHSSTGGRIYARAGGVSQAVQDCVQRLNPGRKIKVHAVQALSLIHIWSSPPFTKMHKSRIKWDSFTAYSFIGLNI